MDVAQALEVAKCETSDLVLKPARIETITGAIANAVARDAKAREIKLARSRLAELKAREREVLTLLLDGHRNKTVAEALGIGIKTVKVHRQRLMHKLQMRSVAELVQFAIAAGVHSIPVPPHSSHCGKKTGRRKGAVAKDGSSSSVRSAVDQADVVNRLMAAAIHELHGLLSSAAGSESAAQDCAAAQLARAFDPAARSILEEERIDVGATLEAIDGLEQVLGEDFPRNLRQIVLRSRIDTAVSHK